MKANPTSALWLELLGGLLVVLGVLLALLAFTLAQQTLDPTLEKNLLRIRLDLPGFLDGVARHLSVAGAWMAGVGALLFFGANYLVLVFRAVLGLAALFALGVWAWLALG
jgi:Flp pilus assembly protein TadB